MKPTIILGWVAVYFTALMALAWWTGRKADDQSYFLGNRRSPWIIVALGLIGDSLSGVSYISVPGKVARDHFGYLQVVFGYVLGYLIIAFVLLPLYYRLGLTSIYAFLPLSSLSHDSLDLRLDSFLRSTFFNPSSLVTGESPSG